MSPPSQVPTAASILSLLANSPAMTRAQLMAATGLSRSGLQSRLDELFSLEAIEEDQLAPNGRGRPQSRFRVAHTLGVTVAADLSRSPAIVRIARLDREPVTEPPIRAEIDAADGAGGGLVRVLDDALATHGLALTDVLSVVVCVGTDDDRRGQIHEAVSAAIPHARVDVSHAVNAAAIGEWHSSRSTDLHSMLYLGLGRSIRSTLITGGRVHRGAANAAGDIGHARVPDHGDVVCHCGQRGCLDRVASTIALAEQLRALGIPDARSSTVSDLVGAGHPDAIRMTRSAGRAIGEVIALLVNLTNPQMIVVGGVQGPLLQHMIAGLRERVYERATPLATRELVIREARLGSEAPSLGAARLAFEAAAAPESLQRLLERIATDQPEHEDQALPTQRPI